MGHKNTPRISYIITIYRGKHKQKLGNLYVKMFKFMPVILIPTQILFVYSLK